MYSIKNDSDCVIQHKGLIIDLRYRTVTIFNSSVDLCPKEFDTLCFLAKHPNWVFTKEQIYEEVYKSNFSIGIDNIIYCLIYGLRKKLERNHQPQYIQTIKGAGYRFVIPKM